MTRIDDQQVATFLWAPRDRPWRWLLALAATISAVAHLPLISPHLADAPYLGEEFIVLTAACLLLALAAIGCDSAAVYSLGILTCGLAVTGYVATRLIAFPQLADHVGNWLEPLGVVSALAESLAVVAAILGLRHRPVTPVVPSPDRLMAPAEAAPSAPVQPDPSDDPPAESDADPVPADAAAADGAAIGPRSTNSDSAPSWPQWRTPVAAGSS